MHGGREKGRKIHNLGKDWHRKEMEMGLDPLKDRKKEQLERRARKLSHPSNQGKNSFVGSVATEDNVT